MNNVPMITRTVKTQVEVYGLEMYLPIEEFEYVMGEHPSDYFFAGVQENNPGFFRVHVDLVTGKVLNYKIGKPLNAYLKVRDAGTYILLDKNAEEIVSIEKNYVPNELLPGDYGDYLDLEIDEIGFLELDYPLDFSDFTYD